MSNSGPTRSHLLPTGVETRDFKVDNVGGGPPSYLPERIGRYRVERVLGSGGFGLVFLAHDDLLQRPVAVKVPHARLVGGRTDVAAYLAEARSAASLDHPNIVPVHDVGSASDYPCYFVSKYIDGSDLATRLRERPPAVAEAVAVVAAVAEGLHHAHLRGLVHRDVKPGNILIDRTGRPFVADFGIALRECDAGRGPRYAGTPPYMSPEQAGGEGHRVDGRSDVFSLGVVLYELLTGRRPFAGQTQAELLEQVTTRDPVPPRQLNDAVPPELERVCLKALAKRLADRYATALEMAADLRLALDAGAGPAAGRRAGAVVPKGLRSFGTGDADFFLDLIPGPRDRHGLPETIRFWKARVEATDADQTFPVGLLYGPSGCGKSSLVKAGLLPRLAPHVTAVYLEASADLEDHLLHRLGRACPEAAGAADLPAAAAAVRRGGAPGEKVLVVIDQFEQWLHARRDGAGGALVRALRQCDGGRLQCLVTVRDDFWMTAARFMRELEVPVAEGDNAAAVDLFDPAHARAVLEAFGRAYGALPPPGRALAPDQAAFLDRAVAELAEDGWVIPVRLALFADMVKRRPWEGNLLGDLGGAVGVGATFLDESFTTATAPPEHRLRAAAVRGVLAALLPAVGTDIKGHARSRHDLLAAAGYEATPAELDPLMRILIHETRLLTPVAADPTAAEGATPAGDPSYQLTHDYLVPSVRDWLTRKRMETRRGRAELRLAERAALWHARPEVRQLPSLAEWLGIRSLTRPRTWSKPERDMMRAATRRHAGVLVRWAVAAAALIAGAVVFERWAAEERDAAHATGLVNRLLAADVSEVPRIVEELHDYRRWADPALERVTANPSAKPEHRLRAGLGLLPADPRHATDLGERLLDADPAEFPVVRDALVPHHAGQAGRFWAVATGAGEAPERRFRAAAALAAFDPGDARWAALAPWVAEQLTAQPSLVRPRWVDALKPVKDVLTPALGVIVADRTRPAGAAAAAEILAVYAADRPDVLATSLAAAGPDGFGHLFPRLRDLPGRGVPALAAELDRPVRPGEDANAVAAGRANAAIALLRLGAGERVWPLLKASPDPRVRSYLIDRLTLPGGDPAALVERVGAERDDTARAALWLALGGFDDRAFPPDRRAALLPAVEKAFREDDSAAVHAAAWWLLGKWDARGRVGPEAGAGRKGWYVNGSGDTMVRVAGPVAFTMGSPADEPGYLKYETAHRETIDYSFDIGMAEVTVGQYRRFLAAREGGPAAAAYKAGRPEGAAATRVIWYEAVEYCNWLSAAEGIPEDQWCYRPNADGRYAEGMTVAPDFRRLRGYRLPTEAEWEFACRAGATTRRCYGDTDDLLPRYAWYAANASEEAVPVALLLPNAFGLFDVHGNAAEWCQNRTLPYEQNCDDRKPVNSEDRRAFRGGNVLSIPRMLRSARRYTDRPSVEDSGGFRLARSNP